MAVSQMRNIKNYAIQCLLIDEWPKLLGPVAFLLTTNVTCNCGLGYGYIPYSTERISSLDK